MAAIAQTMGVASPAEAHVLADELLRTLERLAADADPTRSAGRARRLLAVFRSAGAARHRTAVLCALAGSWDRLTPSQRRAANELLSAHVRAADWRRALKDRAADRDPGARRAAAAAVGDSPARAAGLLVTLLPDANRSVADAAEAALRQLVDTALASPSGALADGAADEELEATLADAARAFPDHRRRGVLESAALLLTPARFGGTALLCGEHRAEARWQVSPLVRWFSAAADESHLALRAVIRKSADPRLRSRAWDWLGARGVSVAAAALDRVADARALDDHEALLSRTHLLANPVRARKVAMIGAPASRKPAGRTIPEAPAIPRLSVPARRGLPRLVAAMHLTDDARAAALAPLLTDPDAVARLLAQRVLSGLPSAKTMAPRDDSAPAFSGPWDPASEASRLGARRLVESDRPRFSAELAARIGSHDPAIGVNAILVARRLDLTRDVEIELLRGLAGAPGDPGAERLAATAAGALGDVATGSARDALRACLDHPVPRVRANAVEALGRAARRRGAGELFIADHGAYASMIGLKSDAHHRVRANALHALLGVTGAPGYEPAAEDALADMLGDDRPMHRAAALWLAERLMARIGPGWRRWNAIAGRIAESARAEPDPAVHARARRCARRALAAVRTDWRERAAPVTTPGPPR